jgi:CubicO group peptidase (beta-lactamase class C family)
VLQLRDRGLLDLDDPVTRWVPELRAVHDPYGSPDDIKPGIERLGRVENDAPSESHHGGSL